MIDSIIDRFGAVIGNVNITEEGPYYHGTFVPNGLSDYLRILFEEYEHCVNNQILSKLDELQDAILAHGLTMKSSGKQIKEIQLFGNEITLWL